MSGDASYRCLALQHLHVGCYAAWIAACPVAGRQQQHQGAPAGGRQWLSRYAGVWSMEWSVHCGLGYTQPWHYWSCQPAGQVVSVCKVLLKQHGLRAWPLHGMSCCCTGLSVPRRGAYMYTAPPGMRRGLISPALRPKPTRCPRTNWMRRPPANHITCWLVAAATRPVVAYCWCVPNSGFLLVVVAAAVCCSHVGVNVLAAASSVGAASSGRRRKRML